MNKGMKNKMIIRNVTAFFLIVTMASFEASAKNDPIPESNSSVIQSPILRPLVSVDKKNPYQMIEEVAGITFKRFADEQEAIRANPNLLKTIVREELMPYINYKYSAFKVIGKYLQKTSAQERRDFVPVFREYLVTSYAQVFTLYDNQPVVFSPHKPFDNKKIIAVNTRVVMTGRNDINVTFKVRKGNKSGDWAAFDMLAEGVSLLDSKQAELGGIIGQKGLPFVTELLKKKSTRNIVFKDSVTKSISMSDNIIKEG